MTEEKKINEENIETTEAMAEKIKIEFPYSNVIRDQIPKAFEIAETVANQWKNNEKFENIGLAHPIAEIAAVKTLEKAKSVEKKLEEKGVFAIAKIGTDIAKAQVSKLNKIFNKS